MRRRRVLITRDADGFWSDQKRECNECGRTYRADELFEGLCRDCFAHLDDVPVPPDA